MGMGEVGFTPGTRARQLSGLSDLIYEAATSDAHAEVFSVPVGEDWERIAAGEIGRAHV